MGAEHEKLVGFSFRICSQGERLTLAFNLFYVLYQKAVY